MKRAFTQLFRKIQNAFVGDLIVSTKTLHDLQLHALWQQLKNDAKNPLNKAGEKFFSQTDEDGIVLEIIRRLGLRSGVFAEFGVGNGSENNTLILLASGWRGFWVGGETLFFRHQSATPRFAFLKRWVLRNNIHTCFREGLQAIASPAVDVLSLDLDGNDYYLIEELLQASVVPKLFIVEYNAKFPPPIRWKIAYNETHIWQHDDYFGASLMSFNDLFTRHGYTLICCNIGGSNAFFIHNDYLSHFTDVPKSLGDLFFIPRYYLFQSYGHKASAKTIERFLCHDEVLPRTQPGQ